MKKILTSTLILTAVSNAFAADTTPYVCETSMQYSSCNKGYYLADGAGAYSETGTYCTACPTDAYCPGGTDAPVYTVTIDINGFEMGFCAGDIEGCEPPKLYRSASAGSYCMERETCTRDGKDGHDTLATDGYIDDPSWVPSLLKNSVAYGYFLENNSVQNPVLTSPAPDTGEYGGYLEPVLNGSNQMTNPAYPGHMTVYVNVVNKVSFDPDEGEYTNPDGIADKIMYKNMPLEALSRDDTAKRQGYTFGGWYTESGEQIYNSQGQPTQTQYDASYNTLYARYILSYCTSGYYPKDGECALCPEYKGHSASSDSETTSITQCYISDSVSWSFTDDMGTGTMKFTEDCYAQE